MSKWRDTVNVPLAARLPKRPFSAVRQGAMAAITEHVAIDGVGFCSEMNSRGLLESLSIRAMVGCPPPVDGDQTLVWLKEGTMYVQKKGQRAQSWYHLVSEDRVSYGLNVCGSRTRWQHSHLLFSSAC